MRKRKQQQFSESIKAGESLAPWLATIHSAVSSQQYDDVRIYFGLLIRHRRYDTINMLCATLTENDVREVFLREWGGVDDPGTLLHNLIAQRAPIIAARILETLGDVYPGDYPDCWDVVDEAVSVGAVTTVQKLFATSQIFCEARDTEGRTALHRTVTLGDWIMSKTLFDMFPPFCAMQDKEGRTPLMEAIQIGRTIWVQYMLRYNGGLFYEQYLPEYTQSIAMKEILRQLTPKNQREEEQKLLERDGRYLEDNLSSQTASMIPLGYVSTAAATMRRNDEQSTYTLSHTSSTDSLEQEPSLGGGLPRTSSVGSWGSSGPQLALGGGLPRISSIGSQGSSGPQLASGGPLPRTSSIKSWGSYGPQLASGEPLPHMSSIESLGSSAPQLPLGEELTRTSSVGNQENYGLGGEEFYYKTTDPPSSLPQEIKLNALGPLPVFGTPAIEQASISPPAELSMSRLRSISIESGLNRIIQQISEDTAEISGNFITNGLEETTTDDAPSSSLQRSNSTGGIDDRPTAFKAQMRRRSSTLGNLVRRRNKSNNTKTETIAAAVAPNHTINHDDQLQFPIRFVYPASEDIVFRQQETHTDAKFVISNSDDDKPDTIDEK